MSTYHACPLGSEIPHPGYFLVHAFACKTHVLNRCFRCVNQVFCIHSSIVGHLDCFQLLAITNKTAMNVVEHLPLWHGGSSFGYMPKSGIAGSSGRCISNFLRNLQIDF